MCLSKYRKYVPASPNDNSCILGDKKYYTNFGSATSVEKSRFFLPFCTKTHDKKYYIKLLLLPCLFRVSSTETLSMLYSNMFLRETVPPWLILIFCTILLSPELWWLHSLIHLYLLSNASPNSFVPCPFSNVTSFFIDQGNLVYWCINVVNSPHIHVGTRRFK